MTGGSLSLLEVRAVATRRVSERHGHRPAYCPRGARMSAEIDREMFAVLFERIAGVAS